MNQFKWIIFFGIILMISSCSTLFSGVSKFYEPYSNPEDRGFNVIWLEDGEEPEVWYTNDISNKVFDMMANKYVIIGESSYNGPTDNIAYAVEQQAKKVRATLAIYSIQYTDTRYGSSYYKGTGGSYSINRYDFTVYYLVKFTNDVGFGLELSDLDSSTSRQYRQNTGALVSLVYHNSNAYFANLFRGDIIININGTEILKANTAYKVLNQIRPNEDVRLVILRNGRLLRIDAKY